MALAFLKTGAASAQMAQKEAIEAEKRKEEQGKMFRFWLGENEEAKITFVDGDLSAEGFLLPPRYYEHNMYLNGNWNNYFVCPEKTNPDSGEVCPICASGDRPALVALFTIIDHRTFQSKDKTKTYSNTRKLLVVKSQTFEMLNKIALKRNGLAGCTFDVSRVGDKAAAVGSMFDFTEKRSIVELQAVFMETKTDPKTNVKTSGTYFLPADYENEIIYRDAAQLAKMGLGNPNHYQQNQQYGQTPGQVPGAMTQGSAPVADYSKML